MSTPTLTSALANFATGGLYGLGQAAASGDPNKIFQAGVVGTSPGGVTQTGRDVVGGLLTPTPGLPGVLDVSTGQPPTPSDPDTAAKLAAAAAAERTKRRRATASILTSPQGVLGDAPTSVKSLLGS